MVGQKHTLVGYLILLQIFPVGQNVRYVFRLVGEFSSLVEHGPMFDRYLKACNSTTTTFFHFSYSGNNYMSFWGSY